MSSPGDLRAMAVAVRAAADVHATSLERMAEQLDNAADVLLALGDAAAEGNVTPRMIRDAASRGEVQIEGPRSARGVRRRELQRWLASRAPVRRAQVEPVSSAADDESAFARTAARLAGGAS